MIFVGMILVTLGVGLIIPVFTVIMDPNIGDKYPVIAEYLSKASPLRWFSSSTATEFDHFDLVSGSMFVIILVYIIKACYLMFLSWKQTTLITKLNINWSKKLFSGYLSLPYSFHLQKNSAYLIRNVTPVSYTHLTLPTKA